ncbi:Reelin domain-containing protein [Plasmodiophora brassicae]
MSFRQSWSVCVIALALVSVASAFTNGTLLPPYLCDLNLQAIGAPTSLAGVLPHLVERNATQTIAGYHRLTVPPYTQAQNLCTIATVPGAANASNQKTFVVHAINAKQALLGLIVWVQKKDAMGNVRQIGHFTDPGLNMMPYPYGCGGSMNQTIVHKTALDDGAADPNQSAPITWQMGCDQIAAGEKAQVAGICVTEAMDDMPGGGFGRFAVDLPV